ncbi:MAG: winged helix-turn-helix transcriptional regulator [Clostridia bacterium]|nr:winged helix-turn-helix transcriptional regulator [Clostridia bacterium]
MAMNETLKAISDPVRRDILQMLKGGRKSAGEIAQQFNLTGATVSYHLSKLKSADLIVEEKYKNYIYYDLNTSVFEEILTWIYMLGGNKQ